MIIMMHANTLHMFCYLEVVKKTGWIKMWTMPSGVAVSPQTLLCCPDSVIVPLIEGGGVFCPQTGCQFHHKPGSYFFIAWQPLRCILRLLSVHFAVIPQFNVSVMAALLERSLPSAHRLSGAQPQWHWILGVISDWSILCWSLRLVRQSPLRKVLVVPNFSYIYIYIQPDIVRMFIHFVIPVGIEFS